MSKPTRNADSAHRLDNDRTFFATSKMYRGQRLLQSERNASLLIDVLRTCVSKRAFRVHDFVIMPDHIHLLFTPAEEISLERAMQFIKGGFSFRLKAHGPVWQPSFSNHRIRNFEDYESHREYIRMNPVRAGLVGRPEKYPYSSAACTMRLDPLPQGLKPNSLEELATRP